MAANPALGTAPPTLRRSGKRRAWLKATLMGVPDWVRRALRLSVALILFGLCGHGILVPAKLPEEYHDEYQRSCVWAAVTAIVVNAPLIGRNAQTACERVLGTIAGGALGFVAYDYGVRLLHAGREGTSIYLTLAAAAVGGLSCYLAAILKLDMTPRFFAMTFMLVTMGAPAYGSAWVVALLRTGGILAGVMVMQVLAIFLLPKSATIEVLRELQKALTSMCEMSDVVWASNDLTSYASHTKPPPAAGTAPAKPGAAAAAGSQAQAADGAVAVQVAAKAPIPAKPPKPTIPKPAVSGRKAAGKEDSSLTQPLLQPAEDDHVEVLLNNAEKPAVVPGVGGDSSATGGFVHGGTAPPAGPAGPSNGDASHDSKGDPAGSCQQHVVVAMADGEDAGCLTCPANHRLGSMVSLVTTTDITVLSQECEKAMTAVYAALAAAEDNIKLSAGEIYVWHFWGHYMFLPGLPNLGSLYSWKPKANKSWRWHIDPKLVSELVVCLRRLSRVLYTIQLGLADDMTPEIKEAILGLYPPGLLCRMAQSFSLALQHLAHGWGASKVSDEELAHLLSTLHELQATSDDHHKSLVSWLTQQAHTRKQATSLQRHTSTSAAAASAVIAIDAAAAAVSAGGTGRPPRNRGTHGAVSRTMSLPFAVPMASSRTLSGALMAASAGPSVPQQGPDSPFQQHSAAGFPSQHASPQPSLAAPVAAGQEGLAPWTKKAGHTHGDIGHPHRPLTPLIEDAASAPPAVTSPAAAEPAAAAAAAGRTSQEGSQQQPLLSGSYDSTDRSGSGPMAVPQSDGADSAGRSGGYGSYVKTPSFIRRLLPLWGVYGGLSGHQHEGQASTATPAASGVATGSPGTPRASHDDLEAGAGSLGPAASAAAAAAAAGQLAAAPAGAAGMPAATSGAAAASLLPKPGTLLADSSTAQQQRQAGGDPRGLQAAAHQQGAANGNQPEHALQQAAQGHIAQVRWASFEWLVGELCEELEETYAAANALLASLPYPLTPKP